jgi:hypothetical protein
MEFTIVDYVISTVLRCYGEELEGYLCRVIVRWL